MGMSACEKDAEVIVEAIDGTTSDVADKTGKTEEAVDAVKDKLHE